MNAVDSRIGIQIIHSRNGLKWRILGSNTKSKTVVQRKGLGCKVCPVRKRM